MMIAFFIVGEGSWGAAEKLRADLPSPPRKGDTVVLPDHDDHFTVLDVEWIFESPARRSDPALTAAIHVTLAKKEDDAP